MPRRVRRGRRRPAAMVSPWAVRRPGRTSSPSGPSRRTAVSRVRWSRPTWSGWTREGTAPSSAADLRWRPMATLHRPAALRPAWRRARVTMPTGSVKSVIQASGLARRPCSAMSSRTGAVRRVLAGPPAPVVSWPAQPHSRGQVSSSARAALWPAWRREEDRVGAVERGVRAGGGGDAGGGVVSGEDAAGETGQTSRRSVAGSVRTSSSTGRVSRRRATPSTSSGVQAEPPPTVVRSSSSLHSGECDASANAFWARRVVREPGGERRGVSGRCRRLRHGSWPGRSPGRRAARGAPGRRR
mgnify:CR=1 FL=1